jgi:Uma2 family endonuclease
MEYLIKTRSIGGMTEEQFFQFCQENGSIIFERNAAGDIILMEPTGTKTGWHNANIATELVIWNRRSGSGLVFDSNTGFTLPNLAVRSADVAYIRKERWQQIDEDDKKRFAHICPDFVIELLSESDSEPSAQDKMKEWIHNGCSLAWTINPKKRETTIYRANGKTEIRAFNETLSGEEVLPGFELNLDAIFTEV